MNFNTRQRKIINARDSKILCLAAPAGGKTRVLTERIKDLIIKDNVPTNEIFAITFTNMAAEEMRRRLEDVAGDMFIGTLHSFANKICIMNNIKTLSDITLKEFDNIIKKAIKIARKNYPKIKHILIDECQDLSELEYMFLSRVPAENYFYVGDDRQCQPEGTKVLLRNGIIKNIEDVKVGDSVVWYDNSNDYVCGLNIKHNSIEKKVTKIANRNFCNEDLITVITENGEKTQYTPNHIGFIKIHQSEYNHAVYLMCDDNNRFRIGKIPFTCVNKSGTNPWRDKMYAEGCSKIWILKVFKTDQEARLLETKLSYKYQIPQTCWQLDKVSWRKEDIDYIYEGLDTYNSAIKCLKEFHRDIRYPLLDKLSEKSLHIHFARNAVTQIFAANIMPEVMDVLIYNKDEKHYKHYEQITEVQYNYISQPIKVYSLEVEGSTYVADNIITHNCIYGFKGCSDKYLRQMWQDPEYKKYYLTENYRNAPNIIDFAEGFLGSFGSLSPHSIPAKTKLGNLYTDDSFLDAVNDIEDSQNWGSWFVLTRTNDESDEAQRILTEREIPNISFKKGSLEINDLDEIMSSNKVKVLTIHQSKGLESPNVVVIGARAFSEEERKVAYVAATRAENTLYWCPTIVKRKRKTAKTKNYDIINKRKEEGMIEF